MFKYILKRVIVFPILLIMATFLIFVIMNLVPGEGYVQMLPNNYTLQEKEALAEELGLNDSIVVQYGRWLANAVQGDFGVSWQNKTPVIDDIIDRIPVTLKLAVLTMLVVIVVGLPLGVLCAVKQYSAFDSVVNMISKILGAFPNFLVAVLLMYVFSVHWSVLPTYGVTSWKHWILPISTLALPYIANYIRVTRSSMLDCIRKNYIRTARSKGATNFIVYFRDALKNALLPLITLTGQSLAQLFGGAVVVEKVFAIPGLGQKVITAINNLDTPCILACIMIMALFFMVAMLVIDILYTIVDPRVKATFVKPKQTPATGDGEPESGKQEGTPA